MKYSSFMESLNKVFHIVTDWLLILLGVALGFVAYRAIDVTMVKYAVIIIGAAMVITGFWSRFKRLRKNR